MKNENESEGKVTYFEKCLNYKGEEVKRNTGLPVISMSYM